ncbi:MAG: MoaD family protein [Natronomonas sp.]|jgi:MoaD family protein
MRVEFEFYATLRDAVGEKTVVRELKTGTQIETALHAVADDYDGLEPLLFRANGAVRPNVTVAVNGQPMNGADPAGINLADGDTVVLSPGVAGGTNAVALAEVQP